MKTLIDFFQTYTLDYELIEHPKFGAVALIFYANSTSIPINPIAPFGPKSMAIIEKAGGEVLYMTLYLPRLSDEEVLALAATGNVAPTIGAPASCLPDDIVEKFTRNERSWLSNYCHDLFEKADFRAPRLEILVFGLCLLALNQIFSRLL